MLIFRCRWSYNTDADKCGIPTGAFVFLHSLRAQCVIGNYIQKQAFHAYIYAHIHIDRMFYR